MSLKELIMRQRINLKSNVKSLFEEKETIGQAKEISLKDVV